MNNPYTNRVDYINEQAHQENTQIYPENSKEVADMQTSDFGKSAEYKISISKLSSNSN